MAALREGVIESMELQIGMPVKKGGTIGVLHREMAELTVTQEQAPGRQHRPDREGQGPERSRRFGRRPQQRLNERKPGMVSAEDVAKAEGELKVADAQDKEAEENRGDRQGRARPGEPDLEGAHDRRPVRRRHHQADEESGRERARQRGGRPARQPQQALRQRLRSARIRVSGQGGQVVEIQPRHHQGRGEPLPIEKKRFRGKITFVDPQIQPVAETAVRIRAEFDNPDG